MSDKLKEVSVELTNAQRRALNSSDNMRHLHTAQKLGDSITLVEREHDRDMSWDNVHVETERNVFKWSVTRRGRIVFERIIRK